MGYLDSELIFSAAQAITANGDTASTNVYDTGGANGQGAAGLTGENLWLNVLVNTSFTTGTAATIAAVLQDSADNSTFADIAVGAVTTAANATAKTALLQIQPPPTMRRYWRVVARVGTGTMTAGKIDAYLSNTIQLNVARPSGFTVDV
jgi:hypothetical protein